MMIKKIWWIIIIALSIEGCNFSKAKPEAEKLWSEYFTAVKSRNYEGVLPLYSVRFYRKTPKKKWIKILKRIHEKLGTPQSYKQLSWKVQAQAQASRTGTVVTLLYAVHYSKYDAQETITVFKPASGDSASILGHHISSNGVLQ